MLQQPLPPFRPRGNLSASRAGHRQQLRAQSAQGICIAGKQHTRTNTSYVHALPRTLPRKIWRCAKHMAAAAVMAPRIIGPTAKPCPSRRLHQHDHEEPAAQSLLVKLLGVGQGWPPTALDRFREEEGQRDPRCCPTPSVQNCKTLQWLGRWGLLAATGHWRGENNKAVRVGNMCDLRPNACPIGSLSDRALHRGRFCWSPRARRRGWLHGGWPG